MTQLTPHFTYEELWHSDYALAHQIDNTPPSNLFANAQRLAQALEGIRSYLTGLKGSECPLRVTSGYRCPILNQAVRGVPTSEHTKFLAADFHCDPIYTVPELFTLLRGSGLPFDQLICEYNGATIWIHWGIAATDEANRQQVMDGELGQRLHHD